VLACLRCVQVSSFVLPVQRDRETICRMSLRTFGLDPGQRTPQHGEWTAAEIRSCCRLAALLDVPLTEAATNIVPVAVTAGEAVEKLRQWASGRCLSAERPGIYSREGNGMPRSGRSVHRGDPADNCLPAPTRRLRG